MYCTGIVAGSLYSVIAMLLFSTRPYTPYSLFPVLLNSLMFLIIPPLLILSAALFIFSKNSIEVKTRIVPDLISGFYSVYLPFTVLTYNKVLTFFPLFIEPVAVLLMIFSIRVSLTALIRLPRAGVSVLFYAVFSLALLLSLCFPAVLFSLWVLGVNPLIITAVFILNIASAAGIYFSACNKVL